jgi:hypothetical protein
LRRKYTVNTLTVSSHWNEINKYMDKKIQELLSNPQPAKQPDERSGINVQGHIKIFDPDTKEVFVQERA